MDAEEASNPEMKLEVLKEKSDTLRSELFRSTITQPGLPSLTSLNLEDNSRGLPPLDANLSRSVNNGTVPNLVSFSGVLKQRKIKSPIKKSVISILFICSSSFITPSTPIHSAETFKIPAIPKQMGKRSLEDATPIPHTDRKVNQLLVNYIYIDLTLYVFDRLSDHLILHLLSTIRSGLRHQRTVTAGIGSMEMMTLSSPLIGELTVSLFVTQLSIA